MNAAVVLPAARRSFCDALSHVDDLGMVRDSRDLDRTSSTPA